MGFGDTFAFIVNKIGKKEYFVDGHWHFETDSPRLYPYNTKQDKEDVLLHAKRTGILSDAGEIFVYQMILKEGSSKVSLVTSISRKESEAFRKELDRMDAELKTNNPQPKEPRKKKLKLTVEAVSQKEIQEKPEKVLDISLFDD